MNRSDLSTCILDPVATARGTDPICSNALPYGRAYCHAIASQGVALCAWPGLESHAFNVKHKRCAFVSCRFSVIGVISWLLSRQSKNQTTKSPEAVIPFVVARTGCRAIALHASSCILGLHDRLVRNPSTLSRHRTLRLSQQRGGGAGVARVAGSRRWLLRKDDERRRRALESLARKSRSGQEKNCRIHQC